MFDEIIGIRTSVSTVGQIKMKTIQDGNHNSGKRRKEKKLIL